MTDKQLYFGTFILFIFTACGYLIVQFIDFYQFWDDLTTLFSTNLLLALGLVVPFVLAIITIILSSYTLRFFQTSVAYLTVVSFALMYLSRETLFLMQMYQGTLSEPYYNFSFLFLGFIMILEMAALWVIPRIARAKKT